MSSISQPRRAAFGASLYASLLLVTLCAVAPGLAYAQLAQVADVRVEVTADQIRVEVELDRATGYTTDRAPNPPRVLFDLRDTWATHAFNGKIVPVKASPLHRVRIAQHAPTTARIVLDLTEDARCTATFLPNPPRLQIVLPLGAAARLPRGPAPNAMIAEPPPQLPKPRIEMSVVKPPAAPPLEKKAAMHIPAASLSVPNRPQPAPRLPLDDRALAAQGNADAQFRYANSLATRKSARPDMTAAADWYRRAAIQGHTGAQNNLGVIFVNGWGVAPDDKEALKWFRLAAERGNADAQSNLGALHLNGRGVPRDEAQAAQWLRKAAEQDVAEAQYSLGTLYANGRGVPHDDREAVRWFRRAADRAYAPARLALGKMYAGGRGVPPDYSQAIQLLQQAATQGLPEAELQIGQLHQYGRGVPRNDREALAWFRKAAEKGSPDAQQLMGELYRDGKLVPRDAVAAYAWFAVAAASGSQQALSDLNSIAPSMSLQQIAAAQQQALKLVAPRPRTQPRAALRTP